MAYLMSAVEPIIPETRAEERAHGLELLSYRWMQRKIRQLWIGAGGGGDGSPLTFISMAEAFPTQFMIVDESQNLDWGRGRNEVTEDDRDGALGEGDEGNWWLDVG